MSDQNPRELTWLDRLRTTVPNYGGYDARGYRRSAAFALRDALSQRLSMVRTQIDRAIGSCERDGLHSESQALDRVGHHLDCIIERVGGLGTRLEDFYRGPDFEVEKLAPVYAIDHALLDLADALSTHFERPDAGHDLLATVVNDLKELENRLDERAILLRGLK